MLNGWERASDFIVKNNNETFAFMAGIHYFCTKIAIEMYVVHPNNHVRSVDLSLRDMLSRFLSENDIPCYAIADEIMASRATLEKFIKGEADLKFMQAVRLMKVLGVPESDYVSVYCKDKDDVENESFDKLERLSYIVKNFDIPALKRLGIITSRAKIDDYEKCICDFLGLQSIYQYEDTSLMPVLFSKSKFLEKGDFSYQRRYAFSHHFP